MVGRYRKSIGVEYGGSNVPENRATLGIVRGGDPSLLGGGPAEQDIFRGGTLPDNAPEESRSNSEAEVRLKSSPEMISSVSWMSKHGTNSVSRS